MAKLHLKYKGVIICGTANAQRWHDQVGRVTCLKCLAWEKLGWNAMDAELKRRREATVTQGIGVRPGLGIVSEHAMASAHVGAAALGCMSLKEVVAEFTKLLANFPHLAEQPVWIDPGPPQYKPLSSINVRPGQRGREQADMRVMCRTLKD